MGGKNSKEEMQNRKTGANHQARRRSSRIALRDKKNYEEVNSSEVEVLDDDKVKGIVENDHIPDSGKEAEEVKSTIVGDGDLDANVEELSETPIVEQKNEEDTAEAGNVEVAVVDVCQNTSGQAEAIADQDESKDKEGKTEEKQTTDPPGKRSEGVVTRREEEELIIPESSEKQADVQAKMLEGTNTKKNELKDLEEKAPKPSVVEHLVRDADQGCSTSGMVNPTRRRMMDSVDSDTEMEEGLSETCSTLLGTRMLTSSGQLAGQASGVSEADCDRMKQVFQSGLAIHFSGEEMEACMAIKTSLFPHQRVALAWMVKHENTCTDGMFGGILADDMGLGKSLTVISLVLTNFWDGMPLLKPELGFTRRPLTAGKRKVKGERKKPRVSAEAMGVGRKLGAGGSSKKPVLGGLFEKFRSKNMLENGGDDKFKFGKTDKIGRRHRRVDDEEEDSDDFIDDDTSQSECSEDSDNGGVEDDGSASDPEFDPKLNMDGFVDDSDSEDDLPGARKKVQKRKPYNFDTDSEEEVQEPSRSSSKAPAKKLKIAPQTTATVPHAKSEDDDCDSDPDSLPDVGDDDEPGVNEVLTDSAQPISRRNKETGLNLIIPPRQPAERKGRRKATLLVCPTSLISHWVEQLEMHLDKSVDIRVRVHHGATKAQNKEELDMADVVITTYGTMASEWGMEPLSPLFRVQWLRVVMDEGHSIKNHNTKSAKAALNLNTIRRWIVTGTPIQNNLMDLWSLVNWLDFGLYAGKAGMRLYKEHIERPCKVGDPRGFERLQVLMDAICLRRTKTDKKPDGSMLVELPRKTVLTRQVVLSEEDRLCYDAYHRFAANVVSSYQRRGELMKNYAHVFVLMIRLRQICCHRDMFREVDWAQVIRDKEGLTKQLQECEAGTGATKEDDHKLVKQLREMIRSGVSDDCSICLGDLVSPVITQCGHVFCRLCIEQVVDTVKPPTCPLCREVVQKKDLLEAGQDEDAEEGATDDKLADMEDIFVDVSSSKINAALKEMLRIRRDQPGDKIIVVSQFTSFLSILQPLLRDNLFPVVRLDGSMSHMVRSEVVTAFQSSHPHSPQVLLLSLKAGGVGLNLTAANHLLLLDPAWNPACEWQCFDRTHRMGQTKDVTIYKFIIKDSIEEKMLDIQAKKEKLISGAFSLPAEERRRQRVSEIQDIFGI